MINASRYAVVPNSLSTSLFAQMDKLLEAVRPFADNRLSPSFPFSDVLKRGENEYTIVLAVAGFAPEDISVEVENSVITVSGTPVKREDGVEYLVKGIANRPFEKKFQLSEYVEVTSAQHKNGLLEINLTRNIRNRARVARSILSWVRSQSQFWPRRLNNLFRLLTE